MKLENTLNLFKSCFLHQASKCPNRECCDIVAISDHVIAIVAISNRILHSSFRLLPPCTRTISWPFYRNRTNIGQIIIEYSNYFLVSQPFETFQSVLIFLCNIWKWPSSTDWSFLTSSNDNFSFNINIGCFCLKLQFSEVLLFRLNIIYKAEASFVCSSLQF